MIKALRLLSLILQTSTQCTEHKPKVIIEDYEEFENRLKNISDVHDCDHVSRTAHKIVEQYRENKTSDPQSQCGVLCLELVARVKTSLNDMFIKLPGAHKCKLPGAHKCKVITNFKWIMTFFSIFTYVVDIISDIKVAHLEYALGRTTAGSFMAFFVIMPLIFQNYISSKSKMNYEEQRIRQIEGRQDITHHMWKKYSNLIQRPTIFRAIFFPYICFPYGGDRLKTMLKCFVYNFLSFVQLRAVIDRIDILLHEKQSRRTLRKKMAHLAQVEHLEVLLEKTPQCTIQLYLLLSIICNLEFNGIGIDIAWRLASLVISMLTIPSSSLELEQAKRSLDPGQLNCDESVINLQKVVLFIGYQCMVIGRTVIMIILFIICRNTRIFSVYGLAFAVIAISRLSINFIFNLMTVHRIISLRPKKNNPKSDRKCYQSIEKEISEIYYYPGTMPYIKECFKVSKLKGVGKLCLCFTLSIRDVYVVTLRHPIEYLIDVTETNIMYKRSKSFWFWYSINYIEMIAVAIWYNWEIIRDPTLCYKHYKMYILPYTSLGLYAVSGICFALYFIFLDPDKNFDATTFNTNNSNNPANGQSGSNKDGQSRNPDNITCNTNNINSPTELQNVVNGSGENNHELDTIADGPNDVDGSNNDAYNDDIMIPENVVLTPETRRR